MKNLRNLPVCLASAVAVLASCSKEDKPEWGNMETGTAEEILLEAASVYAVDSVEVKENDYVITFADPIPVEMKNDYPEGITKVRLKKEDVKEYSDDGKEVTFTFRDGKNASLRYDSYLEVSFSRSLISFDEQRTPDTLCFSVECSRPDTVSVKVSGSEEFVSSEISFSEDGKSGTITFTPITESYFTGETEVTVSNGKKNRMQKVSLIRENFKFADGSVSKEYSFLEYERYFEIRMSKADKSVEAVVPEDCRDWIKTRMSNENVNGADETTVCILVRGNEGKCERKGVISVRKEGTERELSIEINQIASEMDGSLRNGLKAFYNALNGGSWKRSDNWCSDRPLFEWYGISASNRVNKEPFGECGYAYFGTDDVWSISLAANNMRGEIPMEFWKICRCFEVIRISSEYLPTSTVPECVWHKGLYSLDLSLSYMNVPLSSSIGKAENLHSLSLQSCNVTGGIPSEISQLVQLRDLNLRECGLTGTLPQTIGYLKNLRTCYLDVNMELGGSLPEGFYELAGLVDFNISATRIGGRLSSRISLMKELQGFYITGCEFEGAIPEEFGQMDNLIGYDFDGNYFTAIPQFVRYVGFNCRRNGQYSGGGDWVGSAGFPLGVPFHQRNKKDGRPDNYVVTVPDIIENPDIIVDGQPLKTPGYYVDFSKCNHLPFPKWASVKYGMYTWERGYITEMKYPKYPDADDLQYPAYEYYYDGNVWRHPMLEYPAREYHNDGSGWVHDASCPWEKEYTEN